MAMTKWHMADNQRYGDLPLATGEIDSIECRSGGIW